MLTCGLKPIENSLRTEDGKHLYTIEGVDYEIESVTTNLHVINKRNVNDWRVKLGKEESNRIRDEGGDIGRAVHAAGLRLFKGEGYGSYEWSQLGIPTPEDERVRNAVRALVLMRREMELDVLGAEVFVWSRAYGYAGTMDAPVWANPERTMVDLFDWKTSSAVYPEAWLQLAAYAVAFQECYSIPVRRIYPVRLDRGLPNQRSAFYELGQFIKTKDGVQHVEYKEGDSLMHAFDNYMHFQEGAQFIKAHGGRY